MHPNKSHNTSHSNPTRFSRPALLFALEACVSSVPIIDESMDRSAKIAPSCSLQTASSVRGDLRLPSTWRRHSRDLTSSGGTNKASSYAGLPSPDDSNASPTRDSTWPSFSRRRVWWPSSLLKGVSKYPRVCFFLLYVCCTFASGFYASCTLTDWVLERVRAPEAMVSAKQMQESARLELTNGSKCVLETSLGQLLVLKSAVEAHRLRFQEVAKRNAKILDAFEDHAAGCKCTSVEKAVHSAAPTVFTAH